jgi:hypothetical protein
MPPGLTYPFHGGHPASATQGCPRNYLRHFGAPRSTQIERKSNPNLTQIGTKLHPNRSKIGSKSDPDRTQIETKSKLNRTQIDPKSNPNLTHIDPKSNPNRIHIGPKSSPYNTLLGCFAKVIWQNNDVGAFWYIWYSAICCMVVQLLGFPVLETTICIFVSWKCSKGPKCN